MTFISITLVHIHKVIAVFLQSVFFFTSLGGRRDGKKKEKDIVG